MNLPGFTAEAAVYKTPNLYRLSAGGAFLGDGNTNVTPQGCDWVDALVCGTVIAIGTVVCTASCLASPAAGGIPCWACWTAFLGGSSAACWDCIPAWMQAIINDLGSGGGGGNGGGGGGGGGTYTCCPIGRSCRCGGRCVPGRGCVGGTCLGPKEECQ
jgi:hypothetical protein